MGGGAVCSVAGDDSHPAIPQSPLQGKPWPNGWLFSWHFWPFSTTGKISDVGMWNRRKKLCMQKERSLLPLALDKKKEAWLMLMFSISTSHPRITLEFESCERTWFNHLRNGYWMKKMEGENCLMSDQSLSKWFLLHYLMLQKVNLIFLNVMWSNSSFLAVSRGCYTYKRASCEPGKTFSSATFFYQPTQVHGGKWLMIAL